MICKQVSQDKSLNYWVGRSQFVRKHKKLFLQYLGNIYPQFYDLQIDYIKKLNTQDVKRNRNQIFCAPTGSGKTLIFIMKILENLDKLDKTKYCQFKCIYIAPTKSICQQQYLQFVKYLGQNSNYKLKISCLVKDMQTKMDGNKQILVCTPEMMLYIFKKMYQDNIFKYINLLLIDEVHLIGCEKRGQYLQAMIKQAIDVKKMDNKLQISCMSASIPNIDDLAQWLDAQIIRNDQRQIPLQMVPYFHQSFNNIQQYQNRKNILYKLPNVIIQLQRVFQKQKYYTQKSIKNQQYLIFCGTKRQSKKDCKQFQKNIIQLQLMQHCKKRCTSISPLQASFLINSIQNAQLKESLINRFGYHNSGLQQKDKEIVIQLFQKGWIIFLFSTSTLSQGVNLPVKAVIIMDIFKWAQESQQIQYSGTELQQMVGRSGRSKNDVCGYFTILGNTAKVKVIFDYYKQFKAFKLQQLNIDLIQNQQTLLNLIFLQLCSRNLSLENTQNFNQIYNYLEGTLYALQYKKRKLNQMQMQQQQTNIDERLKKKIIKRLVRSKNIFKDVELNIEPMKLYLYHSPYFQISSYKFLYQSLLRRQIFSQQKYLNLFGSLKSVQQRAKYQVQSGLKELRDQVNIPFKTTFNRRATRSIGKCLILVHTCLSGQNIEDPLFKEQSQLLIKMLKSFCELVSKIYQLPNYNNNPKLIQPQIVFFNQIYLKYCRLEASHYNFAQCWEKLLMDQNLCQNFYKLVDEIQSRDKWLNKGFFWLRDMVLYEAKNIQNLLEINQQYNLSRIKSKFKSFQICSKQFQVKPNAYNGNVSFYIFKKQNNHYQYINRIQNVIEFRYNDNSQYKIVAIFQDIIGMDVIFIYQGNQIKRCKVIQLDQQNMCHEQIKTKINDDSMSQSQKQYQLQKINKKQKNKEKKQREKKRRNIFKQIKKRNYKLLAQQRQNTNNQTQNIQKKKSENNKKQNKTKRIQKDKNNRKPKDQQKDKQ